MGLIPKETLEGMYQDTGGVRVRRSDPELALTWGDLERVPADYLEGEVGASVFDRSTTLRIPTGALPEISNGDLLETQEQEEGADWVPWRVTRVGEAEKDGDEVLLQLAPDV